MWVLLALFQRWVGSSQEGGTAFHVTTSALSAASTPPGAARGSAVNTAQRQKHLWNRSRRAGQPQSDFQVPEEETGKKEVISQGAVQALIRSQKPNWALFFFPGEGVPQGRCLEGLA